MGTLANAGLDAADKVLSDAAMPDKFRYNAAKTVLPEGVIFEGATLSLQSETTLSLYFKGLPDDTAFSCGAKEVETAPNGDSVIVRIRGITANELEKDFTVTFGSGSVSYNPMTYCYNVLNGGSDDPALQNVCRALYLYAQSAKKLYCAGDNQNPA